MNIDEKYNTILILFVAQEAIKISCSWCPRGWICHIQSGVQHPILSSAGGAIKLRVIYLKWLGYHSRFLAPIRHQTGVSHQLSYLRSHQKRNAQVIISSGTQNVKNVSEMRLDSSLQKKMEKSANQQAHIPWQIWDTLFWSKTCMS